MYHRFILCDVTMPSTHVTVVNLALFVATPATIRRS